MKQDEKEIYGGLVLATLVFLLIFLFLVLAVEAKSIQHFDPTSISSITYSRKDCKHLSEGWVSCRKAVLIFSRFDIKKTFFPDEQTLNFHNPRTGQWTQTVKFHPKRCSPLPTQSGDLNQKYLCKEVSWRFPEGDDSLGK